MLIAKDGTERPIDDSAAPIRFESSEESGPLLGVVMVFHDITERRRAEQRLENSEVRYRRLFEAAHDGILILETDECRITDVNPFIMTLLDYPRQHFIGKELWEIGVFQDKEASQKAMRELREKGWLRYENLPLEDRNGRRHPREERSGSRTAVSAPGTASKSPTPAKGLHPTFFQSSLIDSVKRTPIAGASHQLRGGAPAPGEPTQ